MDIAGWTAETWIAIVAAVVAATAAWIAALQAKSSRAQADAAKEQAEAAKEQVEIARTQARLAADQADSARRQAEAAEAALKHVREDARGVTRRHVGHLLDSVTAWVKSASGMVEFYIQHNRDDSHVTDVRSHAEQVVGHVPDHVAPIPESELRAATQRLVDDISQVSRRIQSGELLPHGHDEPARPALADAARQQIEEVEHAATQLRNAVSAAG
jgi:hypothetical protein